MGLEHWAFMFSARLKIETRGKNALFNNQHTGETKPRHSSGLRRRKRKSGQARRPNLKLINRKISGAHIHICICVAFVGTAPPHCWFC